MSPTIVKLNKYLGKPLPKEFVVHVMMKFLPKDWDFLYAPQYNCLGYVGPRLADGSVYVRRRKVEELQGWLFKLYQAEIKKEHNSKQVFKKLGHIKVKAFPQAKTKQLQKIETTYRLPSSTRHLLVLQKR